MHGKHRWDSSGLRRVGIWRLMWSPQKCDVRGTKKMDRYWERFLFTWNRRGDSENLVWFFSGNTCGKTWGIETLNATLFRSWDSEANTEKYVCWQWKIKKKEFVLVLSPTSWCIDLKRFKNQTFHYCLIIATMSFSGFKYDSNSFWKEK